MPDYTLCAAPNDTRPFGQSTRIQFSAANLSDAQAHAQAYATLVQCKVVLENGTSNTAGVARTTYTPAAAGSSVTQVTSITHK
jgi:hypothetical protein